MKNPAAPISVSSGYSSVCSVIQTGVAQLRENYMSNTFVPMYLERLGPVNAEIGVRVGDGNFSNRNSFGTANNPLGAHTYNYCNVATYQNNGGNIPTVYNRPNDPWQNFTNANSDASAGNPLGDAQWSVKNISISNNSPASEDCLDPDYNGMATGGGGNPEMWSDILKALDLTQYSEYEDLLKWQEKKTLYEKLDTDSNYRNSMSTFVNFYAGYTGSSGSKLYAFEKTMSTLNDTIVYNDSTLRMQKLMEAQAKLLEVYAESNYEMNEKKIDELVLKTEMVGLDSLNEEEWLFVENLAGSCPLVEGYSVYAARALYTYRNHTLYWDDIELCNSAGFYKTEQEANAKFAANELAQVYYDRNGQAAVVHYTFASEAAREIEVYDILGRKMAEGHLPAKGKMLVLPLPDLAAANYVFYIRSTNGYTQSGKLPIIK